MGFATDAIHAGQHPDMATGAVITPIYMTSTYANEELGVNKGYHYGRTQNFTREALENNIATLENGKFGIAFGSGVAAVHAVLSLLKAGDHVIAAEEIYGGTFRLFDKIFKDLGMRFTFVDTTRPETVQEAVLPETKMVFLETPSNPLLTITGISKIAAYCKSAGLLCVVDNTFMTPYFQRPLELGADIVVHSTTKYLNGHSDVIGGIVVTSSSDISKRLHFIQAAVGAVPSPFDCWLTLRSTKTLAIRMKQHAENAAKIADFLAAHPLVEKVWYPGLPQHPGHKLAKEQMSGFGGMVSFSPVDKKATETFFRRVKIFTLAESLGGVESLVCHPYTMSHGSVPPEQKIKLGITEKLIRLSVGIEDAADLLEDLDIALRQE